MDLYKYCAGYSGGGGYDNCGNGGGDGGSAGSDGEDADTSCSIHGSGGAGSGLDVTSIPLKNFKLRWAEYVTCLPQHVTE